MIDRICTIIWYGFLIALAVITIGLPTYQLGVMGFFFGLGILVTFLALVAFFEYLVFGIIGFLVTGKFTRLDEQDA